MGSFDFIYADNGTNIRRQRGYLYLTNKFADYTHLPNPLPFIYTNDYGDYTFRLRKTSFELDLFALYGCMCYLHLLKQNPADIKHLTTNQTGVHAAVFRYMNLLKNRDFIHPDIKALEEDIRSVGIVAFYRIYNRCNCGFADDSLMAKTCKYPTVTRTVTVPKLGNQKVKHIRTQKFFKGDVPLLITRKKLPADQNDDLADIAEKWGFCSVPDPKDWGITKNCYCVYEKENP